MSVSAAKPPTAIASQPNTAGGPQSPDHAPLEIEREFGALLGRLAELFANELARQMALQLDQPATAQESPWLDFDAARRYLGFSADKLYKLTAAHAIPCHKKVGGQGLMFHRDELDAWMQAQYPRLDRLG